MTVPILRTQRLVLRALASKDLEDVLRYAGDYEISQWLVVVPYPYTWSDAETFLQMDLAGDLGNLWVITKDDAFIGVVSTGNGLGYWLVPSCWGQGIMTEAVHAVLSFHFANSAESEINSSYFVGNHGSRRVLEKLGFVDAGAKVQFSVARGANVDSRVVKMSRAQWGQMNG